MKIFLQIGDASHFFLPNFGEFYASGEAQM